MSAKTTAMMARATPLDQKPFVGRMWPQTKCAGASDGRPLLTVTLGFVSREWVRHVREGRKETLVVLVHAVAEEVVGRHIECRREGRATRERAQLDIDHIVNQPTPIGEPVSLSGQQAEPV